MGYLRRALEKQLNTSDFIFSSCFIALSGQTMLVFFHRQVPVQTSTVQLTSGEAYKHFCQVIFAHMQVIAKPLAKSLSTCLECSD